MSSTTIDQKKPILVTNPHQQPKHAEVKIEIPTTHVTRQYELFKPLKGNRPISRAHVENLKEFIEITNMLPHNQILVNEKHEILDGQHRLEAAKELGLPIFYQIVRGGSVHHASILNACQDSWGLSDYLEAFCKNGKESYVKLQKFLIDNKINLRRFQQMISSPQRVNFLEKFKTGDFVLIDDLAILSMRIKKNFEIIEFLQGKIITDNKRFLTTDNFWRALNNFYSNENIEHDKFKEKLLVKWQSIGPMAGYKDYLKTLLQIYNWKAKNKIE